MKTFFLSIFGLVALVVVVAGMGACAVVNKVSTLKQENIACDRAWSQVENAYQRRADLIPNLVSTIKGSAKFEHDTLADVIKARQNVTNITVKADDPEAQKKWLAAQGALTVATTNLANFVREKYPTLATTAAFIGLMSQLEGTENRCAVERKTYNDAVDTLNGDLVSPLGGFANGWANVKPREFFKMDERAKEVPKVNFDEKKG
jgi:LemA protein